MNAVAPLRPRWRRLDWPAGARRVVALAYLALLTGALLAPGSAFEQVEELFPHEDKVVHFTLFAGLGLLGRWALPRGREGGRQGAGAGLLAAYAAAIEAAQPRLSAGGRYFEWADLACNLAGLAAGWLLFRLAAARPAPSSDPP